VEGFRHGKGVEKLSNGYIYRGDFVNNNYDGFGTFIWEGNRQYIG